MSPRAGAGSGSSGPPSPAALVDELAALLGEGARHEARFIVEEVLGSGSGGARPAFVPADAVERARGMAARRAAGEPLQYVFGHWPFRHIDLLLDARVLIPRPETEQVVEVALGEARRLLEVRSGAGLIAVDAGTGSGAIALALATELADGMAQVWATDVSSDALEVAAANVLACGPAEVTLARGSWLTPLPERLRGRIDLVVSNPPYVSAEEWAGLDPEVRAEP
ncbi:MAG: HemK family protein methyltransferase, partial [Acidimicrobiales bacterium]